MFKPASKDPVLRYLPVDLPGIVSIGMHRPTERTVFTGTPQKLPIRQTGAAHDSKRSNRDVVSRSTWTMDPVECARKGDESSFLRERWLSWMKSPSDKNLWSAVSSSAASFFLSPGWFRIRIYYHGKWGLTFEPGPVYRDGIRENRLISGFKISFIPDIRFSDGAVWWGEDYSVFKNGGFLL